MMRNLPGWINRPYEDRQQEWEDELIDAYVEASQEAADMRMQNRWLLILVIVVLLLSVIIIGVESCITSSFIEQILSL